MAFDLDPSTTLPTPENYATPDQIKSMNDYAQVLRQQSTKPVYHWTQGVANMLDALVGGYMMRQANRESQLRDIAASKNVQQTPSYGQPQPAAPTGASTGTTPPNPNASAAGGIQNSASADINTTDPLARERAGTTRAEGTGGDYGAVGPEITQGAYKGDHAYGRYQIMGKNIPQWTKDVFGKSMSPEEFLNNPGAQDAVYNSKISQLEAKYGPEGASKAWFAGEGGMNDPNRHDQLGTTVQKYAQNFMSGYNAAAPQGSATAAPAGQGAGPTPPNAPQAIAMALAKGATPVPSQGMPVPQQQQQYYPPGLVQQRPHMSREQFEALYSNPGISPQQKEQFRQEYLMQNQPMMMPWGGMGNVVVNPSNPTQQLFIPQVHWGTKEIKGPAGGVTRPIMQVPNANGTLQTQQSQAATPPAGGPQIIPIQPQAGAANAATATPAPAPSPAPQVPAQAAAAEKPEGPATSPWSVEPPQGQQVAGNYPNPAFPKAPPDIGPEDAADLQYLNNLAVQQKQRESQATEMGKMFGTRYQNMQEDAGRARENRPLMDVARHILADPSSGVYTGMGAGAVLDWQRFNAMLGRMTGNKDLQNAAQSNEMFRKLVAGSILSNLKPMTQGTGQIRNKEIDLIEKYNASPLNTVAANRALIEIADRNLDRMDKFATMAADYAAGSEVTDPYTGKTLLGPNEVQGQVQPRGGLDFQWDRLLSKFMKDHPAFTPEETKHYQSLLDEDRAVKAQKDVGQGGQAAPQIKEGTTKAIGGKNYIFNNGQWYAQ